MPKKTKTATIHKDLTIDEVISRFPETYEVLLGYGLHCIGCYVSAYETLEEGLMTHGFDKKEIGKIISELNKVIGPKKKKAVPKKADDMKITLTRKALYRIKKAAEEQKKTGWPLRVDYKIMAGEISYTLNFVDKKKISNCDKVFEFSSGKIMLVLDKRDYDKFNGLKIDYIKEKDRDREGFKLKQ